MKDYFGNDLQVGDNILYVTSDFRRPTIYEGTIVEVRDGHIIIKNPRNIKLSRLTMPERIIRMPL